MIEPHAVIAGARGFGGRAGSTTSAITAMEPSPQGLDRQANGYRPAVPPRLYSDRRHATARPDVEKGPETDMSRMVRFEQINARGEASRPRVDLNALVPAPRPRRPGRRDARLRLRAAEEIPGPDALALERDLMPCLREVRSVRTRSRRRVPCRPHPEMTIMQVTVTVHESWLGDGLESLLRQ